MSTLSSGVIFLTDIHTSLGLELHMVPRTPRGENCHLTLVGERRSSLILIDACGSGVWPSKNTTLAQDLVR